MTAALDHLVVAAASLRQGVQWCEATLGLTPGPGGTHPLMGTHNRLLKLGPRSYLEIIAIDPEAPPPARARWFGLDDPALQATLREAPRLIHLVAATPQLDMLRWGLVASGLNPGEPIAASRDTPAGRLQWRITVREDGRLPCGGALPTLIEWQGVHPTDTMADSGLALRALRLRGLPRAAAELLRLPGAETSADADGPAIEAELLTPRGSVILSTSTP